MINNYKSKFAEKLSNFFSLNSEELLPLIQLAPDNVPWDLAFPCFQFSKTLKKAPNQIATELASFLDENKSDNLFTFQAVWPYLNATINNWSLAEEVIESIKKEWENFWKGASTW